MRVETLIKEKKKEVITANASTSIAEAMDLLIKNNIGCLPVVDGNDELIGIVSDKDIFKKIHQTGGDYQSVSVGDVMTSDPVVGVLDDDISYIAGVMSKNWIRHVPIVDGKRVISMVSQRDIIRTQTEHTEIENRYLKLYSDGLGLRDKSSDF